MWKKYIWNPAICNCKNRKYLASIIDNSVIMCDEIMEETKIIPKNLMKKATCKTKNFSILQAFLLITIALLTAVSIYCYVIKYWAKQKQLLPFHVTNNKFKGCLYWHYE